MVVNDELGRMWREVVITFLKHYPNICLEGLSKTIKALNSQDLG
jgi:hypothetical protein